MPDDLSPDGYIGERVPGTLPFEGVGSAVAAFVGFAEAGPFNTPRCVLTGASSPTRSAFVEGAFLAHAVRGFFSNGGGVAYIPLWVGGSANSLLLDPKRQANVALSRFDKAIGHCFGIELDGVQNRSDPGRNWVENGAGCQRT